MCQPREKKSYAFKSNIKFLKIDKNILVYILYLV